MHRLARTTIALTVTAALVTLDLGTSVADVVAGSPPASTAPIGQTARPSDPVDARVPTLRWRACGDGSGLQCARPRVPLDYDRPNGTTIRLNLVRRVASDPDPGDRRTLFINPGGPGGGSSQVVGAFARDLGKRVRDHFDIVGIDPRGVGGSAPVRCQIAAPAPRYPARAFPLKGPEVTIRLRWDRYVREACGRGGKPILDHMTTADTARDMDLIRQAVDDDQLTYYGISYGTYLGATYAAMFPDQVRAIITDGVLDPVAWSTGRQGLGTKIPFSTRLRSSFGAADAMVTALKACDRVGVRRCPFAGQAPAKWRRLMNTYREGAVPLPNGTYLHYADIVSFALGSLYSRESYRPMMRELRAIYAVTFDRQKRARFGSAEISQLRRRMADAVRPLPYAGFGPHLYTPFEGVACADTVNPGDPRRWVAAGARSDRRSPWFGRLWTWASSACARWPGSDADAFRGPFRVSTDNPVLIVGNSHDPATPVSGAYALHRQLRNSRIFTMDGWGHGAIGQSACVTRRFADYLIDGDLPAEDSVCRPDRVLFPR